MPSLTVENYLKAALQISLKSRVPTVSTGALAAALGVSPGTVTSMLKTLAEMDLAVYTPYEGASLTNAGRKLALRMLRRHRLIELFLVQTLNLPWDLVHAEAENMEHAVSDDLIERIDEYLGRPTYDPHGDPIPGVDGEMRGEVSAAVPLTQCEGGTRVRFVRVLNQGGDFLRYLSDAGFEIGAEATVLENSADAGIVRADFGGRVLTMGHAAAESLLVEPLDGP